MTSLATPAQLATYLQTATEAEANAGSPNVLDTAIAQQALDSASAKIRAAAGWHISPPEEITKTVSEGDVIFLPVQRVTDIEITAAGDPLPDWAAMIDLDAGVITFNRYWTVLGPVVITYTAGYSPVPDSIVGLCLEIAAGIYSNPGNAMSVTYGSVREEYRPPATAANPEDLRVDHRIAPYVVMAFA